MTDYSNIMPDDAQVMLSSCDGGPGHTPYDRALLLIDEEGNVRLSVRTYYGDDAIPIEEWRGRTLTFDLAPGTDAKWLREQLAGGEIATLIDRVIAGHSVCWDRTNHIGRLDEDATEASEQLRVTLEDAPTSDLAAVDAEMWLYGEMSPRTLARTLLDQGDTAETLLVVAESDNIGIRGGLAALQAVIKEAFIAAAQDALDEDGWDEDEVFRALFERAPAAEEDAESLVMAAYDTLTEAEARRVLTVLK